MTIRKAAMADLERMEQIYAYARRQMKINGNPTQWGNQKPTRATLIDDIEKSISYVVEEDGKIYGVFAFFVGNEPTYEFIEEGKWKNNLPYGVIHRVASDGSRKGILEQILSYCNTIIPNLRIDTHHDNQIMQHLLEKYEFERCGIIYVSDGSKRIAYQR